MLNSTAAVGVSSSALPLLPPQPPKSSSANMRLQRVTALQRLPAQLGANASKTTCTFGWNSVHHGAGDVQQNRKYLPELRKNSEHFPWPPLLSEATSSSVIFSEMLKHRNYLMRSSLGHQRRHICRCDAGGPKKPGDNAGKPDTSSSNDVMIKAWRNTDGGCCACSSLDISDGTPGSAAGSPESKEDDMVYRKTVYDHNDWSRHRSSMRHSRHMMAMATSRVVASLLPPVLKLTMVASVLVAFNNMVAAKSPWLWWAPGVLHVSSLPFSLVAPALALALVFRTNSSYGRFDEGRKAWGCIVNRSRDMTRQAVTFMRHPADASKLQDILRYLVAFPYCLKDHLTKEDDLHKELKEILNEEDLKALMSSPHRPSYVLHVMTKIIHNSHLCDMQKALLDGNVTHLHDSVGQCERIFTTPIPVSYTRLTSRILVIWHLLLPLALWEQCHWVTIPATFLSAAILFCIEEVGVLIEEPFSILPLGCISNTIRNNVDTIIRQHQEIQSQIQRKYKPTPDNS